MKSMAWRWVDSLRILPIQFDSSGKTPALFLYRRSLDGLHVDALDPTSPSTRCAISTTSLAAISRMQRWSFILQIVLWQGWQDSTLLSCTTVAARPLRGAQR